MSVKRYDIWEEHDYPWHSSMSEEESGVYVLHTDYADLLARHNALKEAVRGLLGSLDNGEFKTAIPQSIAAEMAEKVYRINRAEVDRLLGEE